MLCFISKIVYDGQQRTSNFRRNSTQQSFCLRLGRVIWLMSQHSKRNRSLLECM